MHKRSRWVYSVLLAVWAVLLVWQVVEHHRVKQAARTALINRSKDISHTLGVVMRSQRRFGNIISKERLESAMNALVRQNEISALALLNAAGETVASAGAPIDFSTKGLVPSGVHWSEATVTLMNLVDLGTNLTAEAEGNRPTIVLPRPILGPGGTNRPPPGPRGDHPPPPELRPDSNTLRAPPNRVAGTNPPPGWTRRGGRPPFGRPPWMNEQEFKSLIEKQGVHSFVAVLSTQPMRSATSQDFWLRWMISALASLAVVGLGLAWRNVVRTSELEVRLVRAAELNARLKEMNLAAAGLAHETRNPLNIIRGLAQMISKLEAVSPATQTKSLDIIEQADHVTAQLNEFINYSRPREVRQSAVALHTVVSEVVRTLTHDLEEKNIALQLLIEPMTIEADERLLRQALFNLLLNAIQAVEPRGEIQVRATRRNGATVLLEIADNGPGVAAEQRQEIFKPYFTTTQSGTGLGLAVVQQIVLAHGWEIQCLANEPKGARFQISHLKQAH